MVGVACAALAAFIPGCSSSDSTSGGGAVANTATSGDVTRGMTAYNKTTPNGACSSCHGVMGEGSLGPNITGATPAGLGGWTEEQFWQVVRNRDLPDGKTVCQYMLAYKEADLSDQDIFDIFVYTQSQMSTTVTPGSYVSLDATCSAK